MLFFDDLIEGCVYLNEDQEKLIYLDSYELNYGIIKVGVFHSMDSNQKKSYYFVNQDEDKRIYTMMLYSI